jgi:hypothetical protein
MEREGFLMAGIRVYHRVWQLYVANIVLFVMLMAIISYTSHLLTTSRYINYFDGTSFFLQEPGLALGKVLFAEIFVLISGFTAGGVRAHHRLQGEPREVVARGVIDKHREKSETTEKIEPEVAFIGRWTSCTGEEFQEHVQFWYTCGLP